MQWIRNVLAPICKSQEAKEFVTGLWSQMRGKGGDLASKFFNDENWKVPVKY